MRPAERVISPELAAAAAADPVVAAAALDETKEMWMNDRYVVCVLRHPEEGWPARLSIRRTDRGHVHDWRDLQRIKNDIAGPDAEAVELYPAEERLVDTANHFWLWCGRPGYRFPLGFTERLVSREAEDPRFPGARQRPIEEDAG
jgi:hypothetical protein